MTIKRHLGLGKSVASKKHKATKTSYDMDSNGETFGQAKELTVELGEDIQADDALAQLRALWRDFIETKDRSELKLNGVIHECDRILRKAHARNVRKEDTSNVENVDKFVKVSVDGPKGQSEIFPIESIGLDDQEKIELTGEFYGIYGLALSSLAFFYTEEPGKVEEFFTEAKERISEGKQKFPDSISLLFAEARVLINEIPLTFIQPLTFESKVSKGHPDVASLLDKCLRIWEKAVESSETRRSYRYYSLENSDFLQALDDLLDMVDNFGIEPLKEEDSDEENEIDKKHALSSKHPLFSIGQTDKYNLWWREQTERFLKNLNQKILVEMKDESSEGKIDVSLREELSKRLGQSYLLEAEEPCSVFTTLTYYNNGQTSLNGLTKEDARNIGQDLLSKALEYLRVAQNEEEPDSWAAVAEAMISLGNMYELDSDEQEMYYKEAEQILLRANNATNGRYGKILENLTQV